jgi:hypothetical protein
MQRGATVSYLLTVGFFPGTGLEYYRNFKLLTEVEPVRPEAPMVLEGDQGEAEMPAALGAAPELLDEDEART